MPLLDPNLPPDDLMAYLQRLYGASQPGAAPMPTQPGMGQVTEQEAMRLQQAMAQPPAPQMQPAMPTSLLAVDEAGVGVPMPAQRVVQPANSPGQQYLTQQQREQEALFRSLDHPLRDNLGARQTPRR